MAKRHLYAALIGAAALSAAPSTAFPQSVAYTSAPVVVYAGPGDDYPTVAELPAGVTVTVVGCVDGYMWCDVSAADVRGWAYGGSLAYPYQGSTIPVLTYGTVTGVPIVTFVIGNYWGSHYRNRSWYREEPRWAHHPPPALGGQPPGQEQPRSEALPARSIGPATIDRRPPQERRGPPAPGIAPMHAGPSPQQPQPGPASMHGGPPPQAAGSPVNGGRPAQPQIAVPLRDGPPAQHGGAMPQPQGTPAQRIGPAHGGESIR